MKEGKFAYTALKLGSKESDIFRDMYDYNHTLIKLN
jgi:hypothetical protein